MTEVGSIDSSSAEPNISFRDARTKVDWAEKQIGDLERAIGRLLDNYRKSGSGGFDPQTGTGYVTNLQLHPFHACLVGDIVFSLRSALDCCWMGLRRAIDANEDKGTLPRGDFRNAESTIDKAALESAFPGIKRFLLHELKAYKGGNEILWLTAQADNWNKHNKLNVSFQSTRGSNATLRFPGGAAIKLKGNSGFVGFGGWPGDFAFATSASGPPKWDNDSDVSFDILLMIGKTGHERHLMPFLRTALIDTRNGVDDFIRLFDKIADGGPAPT